MSDHLIESISAQRTVNTGADGVVSGLEIRTLVKDNTLYKFMLENKEAFETEIVRAIAVEIGKQVALPLSSAILKALAEITEAAKETT